MRLTAVLALAWGALGLAACATTVRSESYPGLAEHPASRRIAVAPFEVAGSLAAASEEAAPSASFAAELVASQLAEQLAAGGREIVAPEDVGQLLRAEAASPGELTPGRVAQLVAERFGADALVMGQVHRFRERRGEAAGAMAPASVGFEVTLFAAPGGAKLWRALFDETQAPLLSNVLNVARYPGGGTRWLTAEDLSRWGTEEVASALP